MNAVSNLHLVREYRTHLFLLLAVCSFGRADVNETSGKADILRYADNITFLPSNGFSVDLYSEGLYFLQNIQGSKAGQKPPSIGDCLRDSQRHTLALLRSAHNGVVGLPQFSETNLRAQSLALLICKFSDDSKVLSEIGEYIDNSKPGIPCRKQSEFGGYRKPILPTPLSHYARTSLQQRLQISRHDPVLSSEKAFNRYLKSSMRLNELPSEWVFRFRKLHAWKMDSTAAVKKLRTLQPEVSGIVAANLMAFVPEAIDNPVATKIMLSTPSKQAKEFLQNKWRLAGMSLMHGPNSKDQMDARRVLLRYASQLLASTDAQWLYDATDRKEWVYPYYIVAASKLDPAKGVGWLKKEISSEQNRMNQCLMLEALWSISGEKEQRYIVDHFYEASKPVYSPGLQIDLIRKLAKTEDKKALPLLRAIILDKRFSTLGWGATRALAQQAKLILGQETKESKRYLRVQHALGVSTYESDPKRRSNYMVDTKHVEMQTKSFKGYLQAAVRAKGNTE